MATRPQYARNRNGRIPKTPQRSNSVLGRLKSLFINPFGAWVGSDLENEQGKRPRHADTGYGADQDDDSVRRSKRKRLDASLDDTDQLFEQPTFHPVTNGYLDPPQEAFNPPLNKPAQRLSPLETIQASGRLQPPQNGHYSLSPQPTASLRSMRPILEETNRTSRRSDFADATNVPLPLSRDVSMESIGGPVRDSSKSPSRSRFRMRTSMTPQPSGQNFGPSRKERERSEPPPLASLATKPMFVKPPTQLSTVSEEPVRHSTVPLGSVAETRRKGVLHTRERSVLSLSRQFTESELEALPQRPLSAAEKALQELEMYKTPLLPSRLRGAPSIPDMFKTKPVHSLAVMHDDRDDMPRLGTSDKQSAKKRPAKGKPYSGSGGVKKLIQRRKREEKEERQKEKEAAIVTDAEEEEARAAEKKVEELPKENEANMPERRGFTVVPSGGGRERSSLRVGRNKTNVYHEAAASRSKKAFSARYDEDEADDEEEEPQEVPRLKPMFQPPPNFSFSTNVSPIKHDSSTAKEPPIAALPFSLSKSQTPSSTAPTPSETSKSSSPFQETVASNSAVPAVTPSEAVPVSAPASTSLFANTPPFSLAPAAPVAPAKPAESSTSNSGSSIPNFFANSAIINNAPKLVTTPFVLPGSPKPTPIIAATGGSLFGGVQKPADATAPSTSLFGDKPVIPSLASAAPIQEKAKVPENSTAEAGKPPIGSLFGSTPATGGFSFGTPPASTNTAPAPPAAPFSLFGASKPTETAPAPPAAPASAFSFGAPSKPAEQPKENAPQTSSAFSFGAPAKQPEAPKPSTSLPFSFGAPSADAPKEPEVKPAASTPSPAPLFGAPAPAASAPAAPPATEQPKSLFNFGAPAASSTSSSAPTIEAPKPLFGGNNGSPFSFGQPSSSPAPEAPKSLFTFGASPSPAPPSATENKAPFTFGSTPSPAPPAATNSLFSGPSAAEAPKATFSFGAPSTPVRPVTPPQRDNEIAMDESPTRSTMDVSGKPDLKLPTFSFSATSSSPFGQPTTPVNNSTSPFAFGAPSSNPFGAKSSEPKPEEKPPATSFASFGTSSGPGFSFGKPAEAPRPSTASGAFSFSQPSVPPINTAPSFGFGPSTSSTNGFGGSSTPASPSTFNQPSAFNFGSSNPTPASATAPSMPFGFGSSQPASPAAGTSGLPNASAGSTFAFGTPSPATPTFGAPAPTPGGGPQFTLGAAPPQTTASSGGRQIKKLPSRRAGKR